MMAIPSLAECGAPEGVLRAPSMMNRHEKGVLYWLARNAFTGEGVIIDAGLFLGASTIAFGQALRDRGCAVSPGVGHRPIRSYDRAVWTPGMTRQLQKADVRNLLEALGRPVDGNSYEPLLRRILAPYDDLVELHIGDIRATLAADRPIDIAFYDCLKTPAVEKAVFLEAARWYRPGTYVVQEDYFYDAAVDVKIRQELLAEHFDYLGNAGQMAIFRLRERLPERLFNDDPVDKLTIDLKASLLRQASERPGEPLFKASTLLALADFLRRNGRVRRALGVVAEAESLVAAPKGRFAKRIAQIRDAAAAELRQTA
jgi:predicted O-methyltransferase YrrM